SPGRQSRRTGQPTGTGAQGGSAHPTHPPTSPATTSSHDRWSQECRCCAGAATPARVPAPPRSSTRRAAPTHTKTTDIDHATRETKQRERTHSVSVTSNGSATQRGGRRGGGHVT